MLDSQEGLDSGDAICSPNASSTNDLHNTKDVDSDGMEDGHDTEDSMRAVLDIVSLYPGIFAGVLLT